MSSRRPQFILGALACAGIAGAHAVAYWVVAPDPHDHAELLASTGHSYWPYLVAVAFGCLVASLVASIVDEDSHDGSARSTAATFVCLTILQLVGFTGLEATERLFADGLSGFFTSPALLLGLAVQVVVAAIGAGLLSGLRGVVRWLKKPSVALGSRATIVLWSGSGYLLPALSMARSGLSWRGPPEKAAF